jgi:dual specificity tyrosine-phosphorylation-regulated kinase 2/3/4
VNTTPKIRIHSLAPATDERPISFSSMLSSPPSSFQSQPVPHKAKKRTSDEFERDQFGILISKTTGLSLHGAAGSDKEERTSGRHRGAGVGSPSLRDRHRDRRRTDSTGRSGRSASGHSQQGSTSSIETRRIFSSDFSPQPSTSSVASTRLRHTEPATGNTSGEGETQQRSQAPAQHPSPSVAHSLLRGTQEGWSGLDDATTAEALCKLDGIPARSLRGRSSFRSSRQNSRARTPSSRGGLAAAGWEGRDAISKWMGAAGLG